MSANTPAVVLLVEDDVHFSDALGVALYGAGFAGHVAPTLAVARNLTLETTYDLVVLDRRLPDGDGVVFARELHEAGFRGPVIMVSAAIDDLRELPELQKIGITRLIAKPVTIEQVCAVVAQQLDEIEVIGADNLLTPPDDSDGGDGWDLDAAFEETAPKQNRGRRASDVESFRTGDFEAADRDVGSSARHTLSAMRKNYLTTLPSKLEMLVNALALAPLSHNKLREAASIAHRVRGSAGTFGLQSVSTALERVDIGLHDMVDGELETAEMFFDDFRSAVSDAQQAVVREQKLEQRAARAPGIALGCLSQKPEIVRLFAEITEDALGERWIVGTLDDLLRKLESDPVDTVLLDIADVDSDDIAGSIQAVRKAANNPSLPIVVVGDDDDLVLRIDAIDAGAALVLSPPFELNRLVTAVETAALTSASGRSQAVIISLQGTALERCKQVLRERDIDSIVVESPGEMLGVLDNASPVLVLVPAAVAPLSGFDLTKLIRSSRRWSDLPVIILGHSDSVSERIAAFQAGADVCLQPPFSTTELGAAALALTHRYRQRSAIRDLDPTTGTLTRTGFVARARREIAEAIASDQPAVIVAIGVDATSQIADTYGLGAADRLALGIVQAVYETFPDVETFGRWSATMFVFVIVGQAPDPVSLDVARIVDDYGAKRHVLHDGTKVSATVSAGVTTSRPKSNADQLLRGAVRNFELAGADRAGSVVNN